MRIALLTLPYNTQGKGLGGGAGPAALLGAGLAEEIAAQGHLVVSPRDVILTPEEESSYGGWQRVGTANGHLARLVAAAGLDGAFVLGLFADCNSVLGMLGGLTRTQERAWPRRVGLVWVDAHGDYNTPETSPSGMLGGMPVATACGKCLSSLRERSGLRVPLQSPDVIMVGLRELDPPERQAIEADGIVTLSAEDLVTGSERMHWAMRHLSDREGLIYVHVDLDILDPEVAPAAGLPARGGITGAQLGAGLAELMAYPKVGALALVSYSPDRDPDGATRREVMTAILGATAGLPAGSGGVTPLTAGS